MAIVYHQASQLHWPSPDQIENPKTLVLGSFNPYDPDADSLDYYYGRNTNYFWKCLANLSLKPEGFFYRNLNAKLALMHSRFCCLDVIDHIEITAAREDIVSEFINKNIYRNFADSTVWARSSAKEASYLVTLRRSYNESIPSFLKETHSIKKVIHTMGKTRISRAAIKPPENDLNTEGFSAYMRSIINICHERNIEFVFESFSPSQIAVNTKITDLQALKEWLGQHLLAIT